jgi:hypothetical protein
MLSNLNMFSLSLLGGNVSKKVKRKVEKSLRRIKKGHDVHKLYRDLETFIKYCDAMRVNLIKHKWNEDSKIQLNGIDLMCTRITRAKDSIADLVHSLVGKVFEARRVAYWEERELEEGRGVMDWKNHKMVYKDKKKGK